MDTTTTAAVIAATVAFASALAAALPPPAMPASGVYPIVYALVNFVAVNFGHAKNASAPGPTP